MVTMHAILATEDVLSEAVGERLIDEFSFGRLVVSQRIRRNGFGYLRSRFPSFCKMAERQPVILFTDLDRADCPMTLIEDWTRGTAIPDRLLFRVAVREIDAMNIFCEKAVEASRPWTFGIGWDMLSIRLEATSKGEREGSG